MASRRIVTPKQTQTVSFVLDFSGSMTWIARDLENSYKREIAKLREEAE
jgi:trehalose-6-phosphatase